MSLSRRTLIVGLALGGVLFPVVYFARHQPFPSDATPEGAYVRVAYGVTRGEPRLFFAYLEEEARWASYTIRDARRKARDRVLASYPEPQRSDLVRAYAPFADAPDGSDLFAYMYNARGWDKRLRKDMSGIASVDRDGKGERASIVTTRGTRWPFRKRDNGIWGLMVFTAELVAEAEKATRDLAIVEAAAADYDRARAGSGRTIP